MKIDDKSQLPSQVGKLADQVHHLEQLIAQLGNWIPVRHRTTPSLCGQELNSDPKAYPSDPISLKDAAKLLGVHPSFIYRIIKQGNLRSWKLPGGHKRVSKADVRALPEPCEAPPPAPEGKRRPSRSRVRKEMSRFTQATLDRFGIVIGEEEAQGA
jgi:excisionase family DNA binding protein